MICPACGYENFHPNATNCDLCHAVLKPEAEGAKVEAGAGELQELASGSTAKKATTAKPRPPKAKAKAASTPAAPGDPVQGADAALFALSLPVSFPVAVWALTGGRNPRTVPGQAWFTSGVLVTLAVFALRQFSGAAQGPLLIVGLVALLADVFGSILLIRRGEGNLGGPGVGLAFVVGCAVLAAPLLVPPRTDLEGHRGLIQSLRRASKAPRVITGSEDSTAIVWDLESNRSVAMLQGHREGVSSAALSADGKTAVTGSWDGQVKVWQVDGQTERQTLKSPKGGITCVDLSSGGLVAFGTVGGEVEVYQVGGSRASRPRGHDKSVDALAFSPNGQILATASSGGEIALWDPLTGSGTGARLTGHQKGVRALAFSDDSAHLYSAGLDGGVMVWDVGTGNLEKQLAAVSPASPVRALAVRDRRLLGVDTARNVIVWELPEGKLVGTKQELQGNYPPAGVAWAGPDRVLVTLDNVVHEEPLSELGVSAP